MSIVIPSLCSWSKRFRATAGLGEIKGNCFHGDAIGLEFGGDLCELVLAACNQDEIVAVASEQFGKFVSDSAGRTCDEDGGHELILDRVAPDAFVRGGAHSAP